jgi:hypothetical protein
MEAHVFHFDAVDLHRDTVITMSRLPPFYIDLVSIPTSVRKLSILCERILTQVVHKTYCLSYLRLAPLKF